LFLQTLVHILVVSDQCCFDMERQREGSFKEDTMRQWY